MEIKQNTKEKNRRVGQEEDETEMEMEDETGWGEQRHVVVNDQSCSSHKENSLTAFFFFLPLLALHPCVHTGSLSPRGQLWKRYFTATFHLSNANHIIRWALVQDLVPY